MTHVLNKNFDVGYLNAKPPLNVRFLTPNVFLSTNFMLRIPYHLCFFKAQDISFAWTPGGWVKTRLFLSLQKKTTSCHKNRSKPPQLEPLSETLSLSEIHYVFNDVKFMSHLEIHPIGYILQPIELLQTTESWRIVFSEDMNPIIILMASWPAPFHRPISWIILSFSLMAASSSAWNFSNKHTALRERHKPGICLSQSWNGNKKQLCAFEIFLIWSWHFVEFCSRTLFLVRFLKKKSAQVFPLFKEFGT